MGKAAVKTIGKRVKVGKGNQKKETIKIKTIYGVNVDTLNRQRQWVAAVNDRNDLATWYEIGQTLSTIYSEVSNGLNKTMATKAMNKALKAHFPEILLSGGATVSSRKSFRSNLYKLTKNVTIGPWSLDYYHMFKALVDGGYCNHTDNEQSALRAVRDFSKIVTKDDVDVKLFFDPDHGGSDVTIKEFCAFYRELKSWRDKYGMDDTDDTDDTDDRPSVDKQKVDKNGVVKPTVEQQKVERSTKIEALPRNEKIERFGEWCNALVVESNKKPFSKKDQDTIEKFMQMIHDKVLAK